MERRKQMMAAQVRGSHMGLHLRPPEPHVNPHPLPRQNLNYWGEVRGLGSLQFLRRF